MNLDGCVAPLKTYCLSVNLGKCPELFTQSLPINIHYSCSGQETVHPLAIKDSIPCENLSRFNGCNNIQSAFRELMECWGKSWQLPEGLSLGHNRSNTINICIWEQADTLDLRSDSWIGVGMNWEM